MGVRGPQGDKGDFGPPGKTGRKGDTGDEGGLACSCSKQNLELFSEIKTYKYKNIHTMKL